MRNKYKMATGHIVDEVEEPLEDVTKDCFVYEDNAEVNKESDNNGDDNETTMDGTCEWDGESSSASSSAASNLTAVTEFLPLEKQRALFGTILGFLPIQESLYRKTNVFVRSLLQAL